MPEKEQPMSEQLSNYGKQTWSKMGELSSMPNHVVNFLQPGAGNPAQQPMTLTDELLKKLKEKSAEKPEATPAVEKNPLVKTNSTKK